MKLARFLTAAILCTASLYGTNATADDLLPEFLGPTYGIGHGHTYGGVLGLRLGLQFGRHELGFGLGNDGPRNETGNAAYYRVNLWGFGGGLLRFTPTLTAGYGPSLWFLPYAMDGQPTGISGPQDYHGYYAQAGVNICLGWFCIDVEYGPHSAFGENETYGNGLAPELSVGVVVWGGDNERRSRAWQQRRKSTSDTRGTGPFAGHAGSVFGAGVGSTYGGILGMRMGRQFGRHELGLGLGILGFAPYYRANLWMLELGPFRIIPTVTAGFGPSLYLLASNFSFTAPLDYHGFFAQAGANICVGRYCIDVEYGPHKALSENGNYGNGLTPELTVGVALWADEKRRSWKRRTGRARGKSTRRSLGRRSTRQGAPTSRDWTRTMTYTCSPDDTKRAIGQLMNDPSFPRTGRGDYKKDGRQVLIFFGRATRSGHEVPTSPGSEGDGSGGSSCSPTRVNYRVEPKKGGFNEAELLESILEKVESKLKRGMWYCNYQACEKRKGTASVVEANKLSRRSTVDAGFSAISRACTMPDFNPYAAVNCSEGETTRGAFMSCVSTLESNIRSGKYNAPSTSSQRTLLSKLAGLQRQAQGASKRWKVVCEDYNGLYRSFRKDFHFRGTHLTDQQFEKFEQWIKQTQFKCVSLSPNHVPLKGFLGPRGEHASERFKREGQIANERSQRLKRGFETCTELRRSLAKTRKVCWNPMRRECSRRMDDCRRSCISTKSPGECIQTRCKAAANRCVNEFTQPYERCRDVLDL